MRSTLFLASKRSIFQVHCSHIIYLETVWREKIVQWIIVVTRRSEYDGCIEHNKVSYIYKRHPLQISILHLWQNFDLPTMLNLYFKSLPMLNWYMDSKKNEFLRHNWATRINCKHNILYSTKNEFLQHKCATLKLIANNMHYIDML